MAAPANHLYFFYLSEEKKRVGEVEFLVWVFFNLGLCTIQESIVKITPNMRFYGLFYVKNEASAETSTIF